MPITGGSRLDNAIVNALQKATKPNVEVRITFDNVDEALEGVRLAMTVVLKLGLLDRAKTLAHKQSTILELTNGSCINMLFADKVWMSDHWVKLIDKPKEAAGG